MSEKPVMPSDEDIRLNGPIKMSMKIMIINTEIDQAGEVEISLPPMKYISVEQQMERLCGFINKEIANIAPGFTIMTKQQAWDYHCSDVYKRRFALPGGPEWDTFVKNIDGLHIKFD